MDYYRKAAAVFIVFIALILPFSLEKSRETAVVDLERTVDESQYLSKLKTAGLSELKSESELKDIESEFLAIIKETALELGEENNYSTILINQAIYQGGKDITSEIADLIDEKN